MLEQCYNYWKQCRNNVTTLCCAKNRRSESSRVIGGFHVTSSPPCWWTINKRSLISSLCLSTSICSFHHCYLCLPRMHENHLLVTNLVTFAWAPFHSIKTSGLNFRQLPCSTEWNSIFAIYTQIFPLPRNVTSWL